MYKSIMKIL